jgi:hypothetical protein
MRFTAFLVRNYLKAESLFLRLTLSQQQRLLDQKMVVKNEFLRIGKEEVVGHFKVSSQHLL